MHTEVMGAVAEDRFEGLLSAVDAALVTRLCEMICRLVGCESEEEFLRELPGAARDLFEADMAWVALIEGDEVVLRSQSGVRRSDMAQRWRLNYGEGIAGRVALDGQPALVRDYRHDPRRRPGIKGIVDREGIRGAMCVPLHRGGQIFGVLTVGSYEEGRFGPNELKVVMAFAGLARRVATSIWRRTVEAEARAMAEIKLAAMVDADGLEFAIAEEIASGAGVSRALIRLAQWLKCAVVLRDSAGHNLAEAGHIPDSTPTRIPMVGAVDGELDLLVYDNGELTWVQRDVANRCAGLLTLAVLRDRSRFQAELRIRSELFDELLEGSVTNPNDMVLRSSLVGIDLDLPRVVLCIAARRPAPNQDTFEPRQVEEILKFIRDHVPGGVATVRNGKVALVLTAPATAGIEDRSALGSSMLKNMKPYVDIKELAVGVGRLCRSLEDYPHAFVEAEITARQIALGKVDRPVAVVEDLGLYGVLALSTGGRSLELLIHDKLGAILDADEASRSEYVKTLRVYFENDRHLEKTARALFVHVNTLRYRLERIQELLGVDLRDAPRRFLVELAVYADSSLQTGGTKHPIERLDDSSSTDSTP